MPSNLRSMASVLIIIFTDFRVINTEELKDVIA